MLIVAAERTSRIGSTRRKPPSVQRLLARNVTSRRWTQSNREKKPESYRGVVGKRDTKEIRQLLGALEEDGDSDKDKSDIDDDDEDDEFYFDKIRCWWWFFKKKTFFCFE